MTDLIVDLGDRSYPIHLVPGSLTDASWWSTQVGARTVAIVTNTTVGSLYLPRLSRLLSDLGKRVVPIVLPDGEQYKDWKTLNLIFDGLLSARCDRKTWIVALGGGVIGDMAGFAAATYQRGIPFVQVPTTLLAQVDSSVGGKTGINHPLGKNMIGAFYQPRAVLADVEVLKTLPGRELSAGLAEIIKHGAIADIDYLAFVESRLDALLACDAIALSDVVRGSCTIKAGVVALDERESGVRAILNFGHTFGHAIEAGLGFGTWLHGEAVACGMVIACEVSRRLGLLSGHEALRLRRLVAAARLPVAPPRFSFEDWRASMSIDKKADEGEIRYVLLEGLGRAVVRSAPENIVRDAIAACTENVAMENA